jgi:diaminohydroxyphosphoribosylaminopyrimidine deaminase/5-amino-6-(5-phosphoribosylamino)uracil reductase
MGSARRLPAGLDPAGDRFGPCLESAPDERAVVTTGFSEAEHRAMRRALDLAKGVEMWPGPNPRVGAVLLGRDGTPIAEGVHRGAGTVHAEVDALASARTDAAGATAVVTLEPCNHVGRTGPCVQALVDAGVSRVVFGQTDPNRLAAGGAASLRAAGISVAGGLMAEQARDLNRAWCFAVEHGRPFVTWKFATTLDGRSAAADGSSRWVSSPAARRDTQRLRGECDAILVGTQTVLVDDPQLTRRDDSARALPRDQQLLRVVMGQREVPPDRRVRDAAADTLILATRDPHEAMAVLHEREIRHVLLEGGPTLAAAFLGCGLVDEVVCYLAPILLGAGRSAIGELGIETIGAALHLDVTDVTTLDGQSGEDTDVRLTMSVRSGGS